VGAALLRKHGYPQAHESGLETALSISHARAVLDVRLAAVEAGLHVETERELSYGEGRVIRPDNLVTLPNGTKALFETEQWADMSLLRRIVKGLEHREEFFRSEEGKAVSPKVRVLFNVPRGERWDRTLEVWEAAVDTVVRHRGEEMHFQMVAMPLSEFLAGPDWGEPPEAGAWEPVSNPVKVRDVAVSTAAGPEIPESLARISSQEDRIVLEAYRRYLQSTLGEAGELRLPSPEFFQVMKVIYAASNPPLRMEDPYAVERNVYPYASVYLLGKYLEMHRDLRDALSREMVRGANTVRWTTAVIVHRMQVVIETFVGYHGWRLGWGLHAYPPCPT